MLQPWSGHFDDRIVEINELMLSSFVQNPQVCLLRWNFVIERLSVLPKLWKEWKFMMVGGAMQICDLRYRSGKSSV